MPTPIKGRNAIKGIPNISLNLISMTTQYFEYFTIMMNQIEKGKVYAS